MQPDFWNDKRAPGVPNDIDLSSYKSVIEVFERSCKRFADRPAFSNLGVTLTYAELDRLSAAFAAYLQNHTDLKAGDRIAVQWPNVLQYPVVVFGALRAGGVTMQTETGVPVDIVLVVQSVIVLLIAAPPLVRAIFRLPAPGAARARRAS